VSAKTLDGTPAAHFAVYLDVPHFTGLKQISVAVNGEDEPRMQTALHPP
jgi:hypothetical protein